MSTAPYTEQLPYRGYLDNPELVQVLTWFDEFISGQRDLLQTFYLELHPDTCQDKYLDYLAFLVGFSDSYWNTLWPNEVKRELIRQAHINIWPKRGRVDLLKWLIDLLALPVKIWTSQPIVLRVKLPAKFGSHNYKLYLRVPISYSRGMTDWNEVEKLRQNYLPATTLSRTVYQTFKLGYSKVGEPVFNV